MSPATSRISPHPGTTTEATHQAPVAQWIEQAPSKRLAAGSSPAGGATESPPLGRAFSLVRMSDIRHAEAPGTPLTIRGRLWGRPAVTGFLRVAAVNTRRSPPGGRQPVSGRSVGIHEPRSLLDGPELPRDADSGDSWVLRATRCKAPSWSYRPIKRLRGRGRVPVIAPTMPSVVFLRRILYQPRTAERHRWSRPRITNPSRPGRSAPRRVARPDGGALRREPG